jgi:hypothetical protein
LNKPPGTKPRNAAARFGRDKAYGDLTSAAAPEMTDDGRIEPSATYRSTLTPVIGATVTRARGGEFWRYGIEQQPAALGAGNASADVVV